MIAPPPVPGSLAADLVVAIPSPDLVVNLVASAGQVLGLLAVTLGGVAAHRRRSGRTAGSPGGGSPWPFRISLGLFLATAAAFLLYHLRQVDADNARLHGALIRPGVENGQAVGGLEGRVKTRSFEAQQAHPRAVSTKTLESLLHQEPPPRILDVREPEEYERGWIPGAIQVRYPDLREDPSLLAPAGEPTYILCYSGNRSSELVEEFQGAQGPEGANTFFLAGGYEKWIAEGRPLVLPEGVERGELRDLASYRNDDVLLDTPEARQLIEEENAIVLDVRYEKEFEAGHVPGAVNLPLRKMPSDRMWAALEALPSDRPILVACYDRRSSFYGRIAGLRLTRLGKDFRGRYTVPWEYFVPRVEREHVAAWRAAQETTLLDLVASPLGGILRSLRDALGSLVAAVFLLVLGLRLLLLPLAGKSDRDQFVQNLNHGRLQALKKKHAGDPRRLARAMRALQKELRLSPGRNMLASILQLVVFLVLFDVVRDVAAEGSESFLWIQDLNRPDPWLLLPGIVAAVIALHMWGVARERNRRRLLVCAACAAGLFALTFRLPAAVDLYLAASLGLLALQGWILRAFLRRRHQAPERDLPKRWEGAAMVPLRYAHRVPGAGKKAQRLAELMEMGLPVPDGFVLTDEFLAGYDPEAGFSPRELRMLRRLWRQAGCRRVAVRSSGLNEDGAEQSFAGVFESVLDVSWEEFPQAVAHVLESLRAQRVQAYSGNREERGGIVVQDMVQAEHAGVLFTEHPTESGTMLVEMVAGLGEDLVSGMVTPDAYRLGRVTGRVLDGAEPPIDLAPLVELARKAEAGFGCPQDIEWAWAGGRFLLVQARDITVRSTRGRDERAVLEQERARLLELCAGAGPEEVVLEQDSLAEILPAPTPMSLALMQDIWGEGGTTALALEEFGIPYEIEDPDHPYVVDVFGRTYIHRLEADRRQRKGMGALAGFRLARCVEAVEQEFTEEFLPSFRRRMRLREALDLRGLRTGELLDLLQEWWKEFLTRDYLAAERINVVAESCVRQAEARLRRLGLDPAVYLAHAPRTVVHESLELLARIREGTASIQEFQDFFGHRAPLDFELSQPRYAEDPCQVERMARHAHHGAEGREPLPPEVDDKVLLLLLQRARRLQARKEEAKHETLRALAGLRRVLVELGRRSGLEDGIFWLLPEELSLLEDRSEAEALAVRVEERRRRHEILLQQVLPAQIRPVDLETWSPDQGAEATVLAAGDCLQGTRVAGEGAVTGVVRVLESAEGIDAFQPGEILVARFTDPSWAPVFPLARGIVTEVGGWLSHAAIQAREFGLAAVTGVQGALGALRTGDLVRLHPDGRVERLEERRQSPRRPLAVPVQASVNGHWFEARLCDLGKGSAGLAEATEEVPEGVPIRARISGLDRELRGTVARSSGDRLGIRLEIEAEEILAALEAREGRPEPAGVRR